MTCDDNRVLEFVRGKFSAASAAEFEGHLRFCPCCAGKVARDRKMIDALKTVEGDDAAPRPCNPESVAVLTQRLRQIEGDAVTAVDDILQKPPSSWVALAAADGRLARPAAIRQLLRKADEAFDSTPTRSREIGALAARLADAQGESGIPIPELRVEAYKDLANVTRRLGDYEQAVKYLAVAEAAAVDTVEPEYQQAIVSFARSILLTDMQQFAAALQLLADSRAVFQDADRRRYVLTYHQQAIIVALRGDHHAAAAILGDIVDQVETWGDRAELARLYTAAAFAYGGIHDFATASRYLAKAEELQVSMGATAELAIAKGRVGALMVRAGDLEAGIRQLELARPGLIEHGLTKLAITLDLNVLEAKIAIGADRHEVVELCEKVASAATRGDQPVTAAHALAWLREYAHSIDIDAVRAVRQFVTDAVVYPHVTFVPPSRRNVADFG